MLFRRPSSGRTTSTLPNKRRSMRSVIRALLGLLLGIAGLAGLIACLLLFGSSAEPPLHWTVLAECTFWLLLLCCVLGQEYSLLKSARHTPAPQPGIRANLAPITETLADPFPHEDWLPSGRTAALGDLPGDAQTQVLGQVAEPVTGPPSCSLCGTALQADCHDCAECGWNDSMISTAD
jgi:hypothetical protein